jgi:hypothetical protein
MGRGCTTVVRTHTADCDQAAIRDVRSRAEVEAAQKGATLVDSK